VPVDIVSRYVLAKSFQASAFVGRHEVSLETDSCESYEKLHRPGSPSTESSLSQSDSAAPRTQAIFSAAWDCESPSRACFTWFDYAGAVTQVGSVLGYFSRSTAFLGLMIATRILPSMRLTPRQFEELHTWLVRKPFELAIRLTNALSHDSTSMSRLQSYLDLPLLFFPFMNTEFYFQSDLIAPPHFCGERYLMSCVASAHHFASRVREAHSSANKGCTEATMDYEHSKDLSTYRVGGSNHKTKTSILWALGQPEGSFCVRAAAFFLRAVLGSCFSDIYVDLNSFNAAHRAKSTFDSACFILAPTHRSYFDFLLLSFISFALPEMHVGIPYIAAADTFQGLPFIGSWLRALGAFFVQRGRSSVDPELSRTIGCLKSRTSDAHSAIEVFIEGTRSRDRRFAPPKTGVLRCLQNSGGSYVIVPISISYERIAEQETLVRERSGGICTKMHIGSLLSWLAVRNSFCRDVSHSID
jgi:Acyltransferase